MMRSHSLRRLLNFRLHPAALAVAAAGWLLGSGVAPATAQVAPITWGSAQAISGDTDVSLTGTFVEAFALGGGTTTVNGVTFQGVMIGNQETVALGANDTLSASTGNIINQADDYPSGPFSSLRDDYQSLLKGLAKSFSDSSATLQLGGLTVGAEYEVELWGNNSNGSSGTTTATAGNSVTYNENPTGEGGALGQYVIGTFTANASTESITLTDTGGDYLNGYEVREISPVPEPTTALFGLALTGVCLGGRRRRQKKSGDLR